MQQQLTVNHASSATEQLTDVTVADVNFTLSAYCSAANREQVVQEF